MNKGAFARLFAKKEDSGEKVFDNDIGSAGAYKQAFGKRTKLHKTVPRADVLLQMRNEGGRDQIQCAG